MHTGILLRRLFACIWLDEQRLIGEKGADGNEHHFGLGFGERVTGIFDDDQV